MLILRKAQDRGFKKLDCLEARYSFSFADYYDPRHLGFGALRALNDYRLAPSAEFKPAAAPELEILSYVVAGELAHRDALGSATRLAPGALQRMTSGAGVEHSAANPSAAAPLRFVHIWILPQSRNAAPSYEHRAFDAAERRRAWRLIASGDGRHGSLRVDRDVDLYATELSAGASLTHPLGREREAWLQLLDGSASANGERLDAGDGAGLRDVEVLRVTASTPSMAMLFDMARDG